VSALCRILSPPATLAAVALLVGACSPETTRPAIPTISAQYAGTRYCSQWSCAYTTCYYHTDFDGASCCLTWTLDQSQAVPKPACSSKSLKYSGGSCGGSYRLDYGYSVADFQDDVWYCSVAFSCCSGGDAHQIWNVPGESNPTSNPNCGATFCPSTPPSGGSPTDYPQPGSGTP
jgi:hypothetical protein